MYTGDADVLQNKQLNLQNTEKIFSVQWNTFRCLQISYLDQFFYIKIFILLLL